MLWPKPPSPNAAATFLNNGALLQSPVKIAARINFATFQIKALEGDVILSRVVSLSLSCAQLLLPPAEADNPEYAR